MKETKFWDVIEIALAVAAVVAFVFGDDRYFFTCLAAFVIVSIARPI